MISADGEELGTGLEKTEVITGSDSSEIEMDGQWQRAARVVRKALVESGVRAREITGVGVCGHGGGIYPVTASGVPVCKALTSMDARSAETVARWQREGISSYQKSRHHPWPGQSLPQLAWLKAARPQAFKSTRWGPQRQELGGFQAYRDAFRGPYRCEQFRVRQPFVRRL